MTRTRIKYCGMTRVEDALAAAHLGVDAIGLVFTRRSSRCVDVEQARAIRSAMPAYVSVVGLFMDDDPHWIAEVEAEVRLDLLQFHGSESAKVCASFATPYVKTVAMASAPDVEAIMRAHPRAAGFVLDGHAAGAPGGSGQRFDWSRVPKNARQPIIVAGGLNADNVGEAIAVARPWAVDVASGIESAPGIKDRRKMQAFVRAVHSADSVRDEVDALESPP